MRHGSFCTGIGGFDIAAAWMGWQNSFQVEKDPFCLSILKDHFPLVPKFSDILTFNAQPYAQAIEIVTGGLPCQPFSVAGERKGADDYRYLWPAMLNAIRIIGPSWVLAENVLGLLSNNGGMVFEQMCLDLENEGYEVQTIVLPAAGVGAPHVRNRVWIIAHSKSAGHRLGPDPHQAQTRLEPKKRKRLFRTPFEDGHAGNAANANRNRLQRIRQPVGADQKRRQVKGRPPAEPTRPDWSDWPTEPAVCRRDDGLSLQLDALSFSSWRQKSIHALGNAIVPEVAYQIFRSIEHWEQTPESHWTTL
jgi:DNA (cytosine-5)-methyltransferase 1